MQKILIIGGNGQLGRCLQKLAPQYHHQFDFNFTDSSVLDITNYDEVTTAFHDFQPDFCINASAYTAVDLAETERDNAFAINADAVGNLAEVSKAYHCTLIHISTDYVFDGETNIDYDEDNFTNPIGVYASSKRLGEELALDHNDKTIIIRTSWLYSEFNKNFVKTMLNLFNSKDELSIVNDQFGQPTNANDLAEAIMLIINSPLKEYGIFHFSNYPETNWYNFAEKIKAYSHSTIQLNPITTAQFPTPAKRPKRSTLSLDKIEKVYGIEPRRWEHSLEKCIEELTHTFKI